MKSLNKVLLTICALLMASNLYAQAFVQSEFSGSPASNSCPSCSLGQVQYQFANTQLGGTAAAPTISFDVRLRAATGVEAFSYFSSTVYLSYNTSAFSANAFPTSNVGSCKTELSKTVADTANYQLSVDNETAELGTITLTATGFTIVSGSDSAPPGAYITINNNYVTLFTVTCEIADATQPAGIAFHASTWDQTSRRSPTNGNQDFTAIPLATASNSLVHLALFTAPLVDEVRLSADNSSIKIVFDRAIEEVVAADFITSRTLVGTVTPFLSSDAKTLTIRFSRSTTASGISIFAATGKIVSVANDAHKNPGPYLLATLPPYTNDIRLVIGSGSSSTRVTGNRINLVLPSNIPVGSLTGGVENIANYFMTSIGGDGTNSPLTVNRAIINIPNNEIVVSVIFNADPSTGTALSFSNRKVCFGTRCLRPIQPALIFPTPTGDFVGPMVTYSHNEMSPRDSRFEAGSIIYTVDFNEAISAVETPAADIYSRTQAQKAAGGRGVLATSTTAVSAGGTAWTFTQTRTLTFDSELEPEAHRIVEYYLRMTRGVDVALNFVQNPSSLSQSFVINVVSASDPLKLHVKVFLEGPGGGPTMRTSLISSLPADDPYCGTNAINTLSIPNTLTPCEDITLSVGQGAAGGNTNFPAGVVDWVLLEVRDAANSAAAVETTVVARKPALLLSNGRVVDPELFIALGTAEKTACLATTAIAADGCPQVSLGTAAFGASTPTIADSAFLVVRHRNHLDIQGNNPITLVNKVGSYDFSAAVANTVGAANGIKLLNTFVGGVFAMRMGDANGDGLVVFSDVSSILESMLTGTSGYSLQDINMDGQVQVTDANVNILGAGNLNTVSRVRSLIRLTVSANFNSILISGDIATGITTGITLFALNQEGILANDDVAWSISTVTGITLLANDDVDGSISTNTSPFSISSTTGQIIVSDSTTLKEFFDYTITINAIKDGITSNNFEIRIRTLALINLPLTITDTNPDTNTIVENSGQDTIVAGITLVARDEDGRVRSVNWSLSTTNTPFAINSTTSAITLVDRLGAQAIEFYTLTVLATKNGMTFNPYPVTITVTDLSLKLHIKVFLEGPLQ